MNLPLAKYQRISRNLGFSSSALFILCLGLSFFSIFIFLEPFLPYLLLIAIFFWAIYYVVRTWKSQGPLPVFFVSSQGPGEELTTRATLSTFQQIYFNATGPPKPPKNTEKATTFFIHAEQYFNHGNYHSAVINYRKSIEAAASLPGHLNLSTALLAIADFSNAKIALKKAVQQAQDQATPIAITCRAACHGNLGVIDFRQGRLTTARQHYTIAFDHFKTLEDQRGQADMQLNIGNTYAHQGAWENASVAYNTALEQQQQIGSELGQAISLSNIGNTYRNNPAQALKCFHKALALHDGIDNTLGRANTLTNIGNLRFRQNEFDIALGIYNKALNLYQEVASPLGEATIFSNLGNISFKQGELEQALEQYQQALSHHHYTGNTLGQANTLTNIGSLYIRQDKPDLALEALTNARSIYQEAGAQSQGSEAVDKLLRRLDNKKKKKQ